MLTGVKFSKKDLFLSASVLLFLTQTTSNTSTDVSCKTVIFSETLEVVGNRDLDPMSS